MITALSIRSWITALKAVCVIGLLPLILQCQDPYDWQPGDPQIPPPDPPELYMPYPDTIFNGSAGYNVQFDWEEISGYQVLYEVQTDTLSSFSTGIIMSASSSPATFFIKRYSYKTNYYCRVRAGSPAWTWYTGWSETHHFRVDADP